MLEELGQGRCWEADERQKWKTQPLAGFQLCAPSHWPRSERPLLSSVVARQIRFTSITAGRIAGIDQSSFQQNILQRLTI
ncbi:hypothetical protein NL64_05475 [Pseudomonas fluorescens]|nr:hypothetical protein NL64_05475 [Pseudomonas fluorescens]